MSSRTAFKVLCALFVVAVFAPVADAQLNYTYTGAYTYPITLPAVSGYGTPLTRVSVTLNGLTTPNIHSLGIMLQGPNGKLVLIRNTGSPAAAAFSFGCMIRWLDLNDTFTGATGGHPSDNLAGILMLADHLSRSRGRTT